MALQQISQSAQRIGQEFFHNIPLAVSTVILTLLLADPHPFLMILALGTWTLSWALRLTILAWLKGQSHDPSYNSAAINQETENISWEIKNLPGSPYTWLRAPLHTSRILLITAIALASGAKIIFVLALAWIGYHGARFFRSERHHLALSQSSEFRRHITEVPAFLPRSLPPLSTMLSPPIVQNIVSVAQQQAPAILLSGLWPVVLSCL